MMARKPRNDRLEDIASHAGVGMATVDRVLNERGGVSQKTVAKVLVSAKALGARRILPSEGRRHLVIEAVLSRRQSGYYSRLNKALQEVSKLVDLPVTIYRTHIDADEPAKLARHLDEVAGNRDGIILCAGNLPQVAEAVRTVRKRTVMVTISTDISNSDRHCFVGIDNFNAGKSAAKISEAICRKGGKVLMVAPENLAQSQEQRFAGFRQFFDDIGLLGSLIIFHQDKMPALALVDILRKLQCDNDIRVLYSPITNTFLELVIESGRQESAIRSTAKIVHDLGPHSAEYLRDGLIDMVIDSNPLQQAFQAIEFIAVQYGYATKLAMPVVDFQLYTLENLPRLEFSP
jgi:LacI family transcriptional regulator